MANVEIIVDFTKWPEVLHGIRREVAKAIEAEAADAAPEVAAALIRVAARIDAGLTDVASLYGGLPDGPATR